jgi:5-oxoprolinase (ATP-hydrolysing)
MPLTCCADRGGTFSDCYARIPGRDDVVIKLLSHDPSHYADAPTEGVRRILEIAQGRSIARGDKIDTSGVGEWPAQVETRLC